MRELATEIKEVDWNEVSRRPDLPVNFIRKHADKLNWKLLMENIPLTDDLFKEYANHIDWGYMAENKKIPEEYMDVACSYLNNHASEIDWLKISRNLNLSEDFLMRLNTIDFNCLVKNRLLSSRFLIQKANHLNWTIVSQYQIISEDIIEMVLQDNLWGSKNVQFWLNLTVYQILSENFIRKYADKLDFFYISSYQKLSEPFIEEFSDCIDWEAISGNQKLSDDFIIRHADDLDWGAICHYQTLSESVIEECIDKVNWGMLFACQPMSDTFWIRHADKIKYNYLDLTREEERSLSAQQKKQKIMLTDSFKCFDDYFLGYLVVRSDGYYQEDFRTQYCVGQTYTAYTDPCQRVGETGIEVRSKKEILKHENLTQPNHKILKVKINYEDFSSLNYFETCAVCSKITVLEEIKDI